MKRLMAALLGGLICALICTIGRKTLIPTITLSDLLASAVGNRILIGFVIGISRMRMHYLLHGALIGLIVTLSYSIGMISRNINGFFVYTSMGIIFGMFIELLIARVFKIKEA